LPKPDELTAQVSFGGQPSVLHWKMEESIPVQHAVRGTRVFPQCRKVLSQNGRQFPSVVQPSCPQLTLMEQVRSPLKYATSRLQVSQVPPLWPHTGKRIDIAVGTYCRIDCTRNTADLEGVQARIHDYPEGA
jgi:hypothetical protein